LNNFDNSNESRDKKWDIYIEKSNEIKNEAKEIEWLLNKDLFLLIFITEISDKSISSHENRMTWDCREECLLKFKFLDLVVIYSLLSIYFVCVKAFYIDQ